MQAASLEMRSESDSISVRHRDHPTEGASAVDVSRRSSLGNPFRVLRRGRLDEAWRDAVCDAFHWAHRLAMSGTDATSLEEIAALHELPTGSIASSYAALGCGRRTRRRCARRRGPSRNARRRGRGSASSAAATLCAATPHRSRLGCGDEGEANQWHRPGLGPPPRLRHPLPLPLPPPFSSPSLPPYQWWGHEGSRARPRHLGWRPQGTR